MTWLVDQKNGKTFVSGTAMLEPRQLRVACSPLAWKILKMISEKPSYPKEISNRLKVHEQKVYYHIRNLEKAGLVENLTEERKKGALARIYTVTNNAFTVLLRPLMESQKIFQMKKEHKAFLEPFVSEGKFNALIVLGSPEPHGVSRSRAKDGLFATDLGLFFGAFLNYIPEVSTKLDTEIREEDLKNNLILIGGPGVNVVTSKVNSKLPIRFEKIKEQENFYSGIHSEISGKEYSEEGCGIIVKTKNPFDKTKEILVIAGRRISGTRASISAFLKNFDEICKGNLNNPDVFANVVEGIDRDSDGIVDAVEFLE
jgi:DNA-binding PadR family transcriptional regulator